MINATQPTTTPPRHSGLDDPAVLEFAVFCIENVADALGKPSGTVYRLLAGDDGILRQYIVPSYDVLHTQGREYIVDDILEVMRERGVSA